MKRTEILIVGHGLAGSLLAWELQQSGVNFLVMNAPQIHRSSDVAGGLFNPLMFRKLRLSQMVADLWPVMQATYEAIENHYGIKLLHHILSAKMLSYKEISEWEQGKEELIAKLNKVISSNYKILAHKAGVRPAIKDRMPVLGTHPKHNNLLIFNGLGSKGVVLAPYCAKVLVKHLLLNNEPIPDFLNVGRLTDLSTKNGY